MCHKKKRQQKLTLPRRGWLPWRRSICWRLGLIHHSFKLENATRPTTKMQRSKQKKNISYKTYPFKHNRLKSQSNKHCPYLWPVLLLLPPEPLKPNCWREFNLLGLQRKYAVRSSGYKSNWIGLQTRKTLHDRESQQK